MLEKILRKLKSVKKSRVILFISIAFFVFLTVDTTLTKKSRPKEVDYLEFQSELKQGHVDVVYYNTSSDIMQYCLFNDKTKEMPIEQREKYEYKKEDTRQTTYPSYDDFRKDMLENGVRVEYKEFKPISVVLLSLILSLVIPVMMFIFIFIIFKQYVGIGKLEKESGLLQHSDTKFEDVIGHDETIEDLQFIVNMLKNPKLGVSTGARLPKGILFSGNPGTGKTLLAKAIAGEADVPFLYMNASSVIEMYVGVGAKRIRDLFKVARKNKPCILFIDEIDAVGGKRSSQSSTVEHDQTLNALLQEMDGFTTEEGVFVIAATNTPDKLDKALVRAGRFDREIVINPPRDWHVRKELFEYYLESRNRAEDLDIDNLAKQTAGFTGADIEAVLNEASIIAAMQNMDYVNNSHIEEAIDKYVFKGNKSKRNDDDKKRDRTIVAYHEAGHAVVSYLLGIKLARASIAGTVTGVGGAVFSEDDDTKLLSKTDLENKVKVCYGGRASEELKFSEVTIGASNDITKATSIIDSYIKKFGFDNDLGLLDIEVLNHYIDNEAMLSKMSELSTSLYNDTLELLRNNYSLVEKLAERLLQVETLSASSIYELLEGD